ncbi:COPII subunit [Sorochytrium milnesiophthora]
MHRMPFAPPGVVPGIPPMPPVQREQSLPTSAPPPRPGMPSPQQQQYPQQQQQQYPQQPGQGQYYQQARPPPLQQQQQPSSQGQFYPSPSNNNAPCMGMMMPGGGAPSPTPQQPQQQMRPPMPNMSPGPRPPMYQPGGQMPMSPSGQMPPLQQPPASPVPGGQAANGASASSPVQGTFQQAGQPPAAGNSKRRMYPEQITRAYQESPGAAPMDPFGAAPPQYSQPAPDMVRQMQMQQQQQQPSTSSIATNDGFQMPQPNVPMPLYPKATYGSQASLSGSLDGLANSFSQMGVGTPIMQPVAPSQPVALIGAPPTPAEAQRPPPVIRLTPQAACTPSPFNVCPPAFKRSTINVIPQTGSLLNKSRVPLALVIAPFRTLDEGEPEVPVINTQTIVRCRKCRTYINPYVQFLDKGQRWKCNLCYYPNDVPEAFDFDFQSQQYVDRWQRPELTHAVVEFIAPSEYMARPPQPPVFLFIIDVSYNAVQSGMVATAAKTLLNNLDSLPNQDGRTMIGIITVDSSLHFYNLNATIAEPQMLVMSDLEEPFLPLPHDLLANLNESKQQVMSLLEKLPSMFHATHDVGNALGPALQAAYKLTSPYGGKILVLQATLPNLSTGALKVRDDKPGVFKLEPTMFQPGSSFYKQFAVDCSRSHISIDMFLFGTQYLDAATLCCCSRYTGGSMYMYPGFNAARQEDVEKLSIELAHILSRPIALEAVMRVRASRGLRMSGFHGNFFIRSSDLLALPNVNPDNTYAIEVAIEDSIQSSVVCFQTALLHTTSSGERRIRVLTLTLPVTSSLSDIYQAVDQGALVNLLGRKAIQRAVESKFEDARDAVINKCVDLLGVYKSVFGGSNTGAQLLICENLRMIALLSLGLTKHMSLRVVGTIPTDLRVAYMEILRVAPIELSNIHLHPYFYALHNMSPQAGTTSPEGQFIMPPLLPISSERLERHGVYVLFDGMNIFIWVSRMVDPQLLGALFNKGSYDELVPGKCTLPSPSNPYSKRVHAIIDSLRNRSMRLASNYPFLYIVKEDSDPSLRMLFLSTLYEDRAEFGSSYPQFLSTLREKVTAGSFN